jgi:energy-coupling factor transporter transmembrane protein EcfT
VPFKAVEYVYVPLQFGLVGIGTELTVASLTRGLGLHKDMTYVNDIRTGALDYLVLALMLGLILISKGVWQSQFA